jgi:transcriptional regulator with XRE-family HTH domain
MGDDSIPAARLGELLRAARKRRGFTRKQAAAAVRITPDELRAYERGHDIAPADVCARFSECYGVEIVPARVPLQLDAAELTADDATRVFVELVQQLRGTKPGEALRFRSDDLAALASALESDAETIERRIMSALGCSREEAKALRHELLRRKIVLPVAGLAAGLAALAGMHAAGAHDAPPRGPVVASPTTAITAARATTTTTTVAPTTTTTMAPRPTVTTPPAAPPVEYHEPPATVAPQHTTEVTRPIISPDDTVPEGILPGEHPLPPPTTP